MVDQNQSVHTVFTGEANLQAAEAELRQFAQQFETVMARMAKATDQVDQRTLNTVRKFNRAMSSMRQAQSTLSETGMGFAGRAAKVSDAAEAQAARRRTDQMARLVELEKELERVRARGSTSKRAQTRIDNLERERRELQLTYEAETKLAEQRRRVEARTLTRTFGSYERQTQTEARSYLRTQERVLEIQNRLNAAQAGQARLSQTERGMLQNELNLSERLLRIHEQDAAVMARVTALQQRAMNKKFDADWAQAHRDNRAFDRNLGGVRLNAEAENRERDLVAKNDARLKKAAEREAQRRMVNDRLNAEAENRELKLIERNARARQKAAERQAADRMRNDRLNAEAENRELALIERNAARRQKAAERQFDRTYAQAQRDNAEFNRTRSAPASAARSYLGNEQSIERINAQILRLKQSQNATDARQITLLDQELARLAKEQEALLRIQGIEARIASERAKRARTPLQREESPAGGDPRRRMAARADLMADYSSLAAVSVAAYSLWDFAVKDESTLAQFRAIATASGSETARLATQMKELGQETRFSNLEIAETATLLAQAGLSASDTGPALKSVSLLATAAGVELKQAADVVTSTANIWGYNTTQMMDVANVLTAALNQTKLGMDQMQLGIQYAGNTAVDAGVDFVELTSIMGAMAQAGIRSGSTIGTGLRALIVDLQNPTEKTVATMDRLGLSMADVDVRTLGLTQVLHNLKAAGFTSADAMGAFEIRAAAAFAAISNNLNVVDGLQTSLYDSDAAAAANAIQMDTLAAKWQVFTNAALAAGATGLKPVIELLKVLLTVGAEVLKVVDKLGPVLQVATTAAVAMMASFAVNRVILAVGAFQQLMGAVIGLTGATQGAAVAAGVLNRALLGWVGIAAGVITLGLSMFGMFKDGNKTLDDVETNLNSLTSRMAETQQVMKSVDDATHRLTTRYTELANNSVMKTRLLQQTRERFKDLGLQIDEGTTSVDGMLEALKNLREELEKEYQTQLLDFADELKQKVEILRADIRRGKVVSDETKRDVRSAMWMENEFGITNRGRGREARNLEQVFGPAGDLLLDLMEGRRKIGEDTTAEELHGAIEELRRLRDATKAERDRSSGSTRTGLDDKLNRIDRVLAGGREIRGNLTEISRAQEQEVKAREDLNYERWARGQETDNLRSRNSSDLLIDSVRTSFGAPAEIQQMIREEIRKYEPEVNAIRRSEISNVEKAKSLEELESRVRSRVFDMIQVAEGTLPAGEDRTRFMAELEEDTASLISELIRPSQAIKEQAEREARAGARTGQNATDDRQELNQQLSKAELDALKARLAEVQSQLEEIQRNGGTLARIEELRQEGEGLIGRIAAAEQAADQANTERTRMFDRRGGLILPAQGVHTSSFGPRVAPTPGASTNHQGLDIGLAQGSRVNAAGTGTVVAVGERSGYGRTIEIEHENGIRTLYAHLSEFLVREGERVSQGQEIAKSGGAKGTPGAGKSTGSHLHFGVSRNGTFINPLTAIGQGGAAAENDPELNRLQELQAAEAAARRAERERDFRKLVDETVNEVRWEPLEDFMKSQRQTNNQVLSNLVEGIAAGDGTTSLEDLTAQIRELTSQNVGLAKDLLELDPDNAARRNNPVFQNQVEQEVAQELIRGMEALDSAYSNYAQLQASLGNQRMADTQNQLRIANATAGTSETTKWLLGQRLELEQYETALAEVTAAEQAHADALINVAQAQALVAKAQEELNAATTDEDKNAARGALASAQAVLGVAQGLERRTSVSLQLARAGATAATPVNPITPAASTATASGLDWMGDPLGSMNTVIAMYKERSGVLVDAAQTISDGIYGTFNALGEGIEATINQIADGSITLLGLFSNLFGGVLKELQQTAAKIAANWIMRWIISKVASFAMPSAAAPAGGDNGGLLPGSLDGYKLGGVVKRYALGGGTPNRDSQLALTEPGEIVMRKSAVDFVGRDTLLAMNALGNRRLSAAGARIPALPQREKDEVNVWMVAPDQVPPPSKKDVIFAVSDSMRNGELKKLVKQISVGG